MVRAALDAGCLPIPTVVVYIKSYQSKWAVRQFAVGARWPLLWKHNIVRVSWRFYSKLVAKLQDGYTNNDFASSERVLCHQKLEGWLESFAWNLFLFQFRWWLSRF